MVKIHTSDDEIRAMQRYLDDVMDHKKPLKSWKTHVRTALFLLVFFLLIHVLYSVFSARSRGETPEILGFQFYQIESGSMEPTLEIGNVIVSRTYKVQRELAIGDIITYEMTNGTVVTHRIVEVTSDEDGHTAYRTKGDNPDNSVDAELLTPDRIRAVMVYIVPFT